MKPIYSPAINVRAWKCALSFATGAFATINARTPSTVFHRSSSFLLAGSALDDLSLDPFAAAASQNGSKSRNCSGGSTISQGLVSSGILPPSSSSNPVSIPGQQSSPPPGLGGPSAASNSSASQQQQQQQQMLMNQLGFFDLTSPSKSANGPSSSPPTAAPAEKDVEIARLKEELAEAK